jgi:hypothetical protein
MNVFEFYADKSKHDELSEMFTYAAQQHKNGLAANFQRKMYGSQKFSAYFMMRNYWEIVL